MRKLLLLLAVIASPVQAKTELQRYQEWYNQYMAERAIIKQQEQVEFEALMREADRHAEEQNARIQKSVDAYLKASDEYSKFLATCKTCVGRHYRPSLDFGPMIRIPKDNTYVPICSYGSC